jgi:cell division protein FtsI/penicillin-binding protein 2
MSGFFREKRLRRAIAAAFLLVAGWSAAEIVAAANRHQLPSPSRSAPISGEKTLRFEHGLPPQLLCDILKSGEAERTLPDGSCVKLAINPALQEEIFELFRRFDPPYGVFVAMEPSTGRVVALVGYRRGGEADPWLALKAIYPAASLIKVITASAAIERGNVSPDDEISYRGGIYGISRSGIHSDTGGSRMTLEEAIARSANSVLGKVAVRNVGAPALGEYLGKFGFGQPIPFDLPVEPSRAEVPQEEYELARTGAGFGEVYVSPLHMAMVMSALASRGPMPRPLLVDRILDDDGDVEFESAPSKFRDTVRPETTQAVVQMMVKTIEMGTSHRTFGTPDRTPLLQHMDVAGKTGSLSGWTPLVHFEWFAGLAPAASPKLALAALVVNDDRWKIKGSYVGKEAFSTYFGYPSSSPPSYYARGGKKGGRKVANAGKKKTVKVGSAKKSRSTKKRARVNTTRRSAVSPVSRIQDPIWNSNA